MYKGQAITTTTHRNLHYQKHHSYRLFLMPQFGHEFKARHFPESDNSFVPVNHGSYGLHPKCVMDKYLETVHQDLASPDEFATVHQKNIYTNALKATAKLLNCSHKNLALVATDTAGVTDVLRSLPFKEGDTIAVTLTTFDTCSKLVRHLKFLMNIEIVVVQLDFPLLHKDIIDKFQKLFEAQKITLALFDTVSSMPAMKMPFAELTQLCRKHGVLSLVDGAHLFGLIPIDLSEGSDFRPDFYTSNLHKWLYVPRGCAVLYVDPKFHRIVQPMPLLHSYTDPDENLSPEEEGDHFWQKFILEAAKWFPGLACVETAIDFRSQVCGGESAIREYCFQLAREVIDMAEEKWPGTKVIENEEKTLVTAMVSVNLPLTEKQFEKVETDFTGFKDYVVRYTLEERRTLVPMCIHNGKVVARFSCQIYNELPDFEHSLAAVKSAVDRYFSGVE